LGNLDSSSINEILLPYIPIEEQHFILDFLIQKTTEIDSLIEKLEKKIELLKEYRTALISQCVTKGLDPDADMKDSGIEWIGEIPKNWEVTRLAVMGAFSKGSTISKGDLIPEGHPCILYGELYTKFDRKVSATHSRISVDLFKSSKTVNNGTFLFTASGETADEIGKCLLVLCNEFVAIGGDSTIFRLFNENEFDVEYLSYALNAEYCRVFKTANSRGEIVVHIYAQQLKNLRVVYPSIQAQKIIRQHLDNKTVNIDSLIEKLERKIELLKEYRQSLISNVVTGKVRVVEQVA